MKAKNAPARTKKPPAVVTRPRMTRALAEQRAVGDSRLPKFDGVKFIQSLKK
jgi:hypothetical protein